MPKYEPSQDKDANFQTIIGTEGFKAYNAWTFVTATTGATGAHTLFTVTGDVIAVVFGLCKTNLTGAGTIEVGVSGNTAYLINQIANATTVDANDSIGAGSSGESLTPAYDANGLGGYLLSNGTDIIMTIGTTAITGGVIDFYCIWRPLSSDGNLTATTPA